MIKKIGILTSGGDAPGMNATIVSAIRTGINLGKEMYVVYDGYKGLITQHFTKVDKDFAVDKINVGGTVIKTARLPEFKELSCREKAVANLKQEGIDALIVIGGDGSYMGAKKLTEMGINCVGLPGTIDNDIASSDTTIGFDTALNTIVDAIDNIAETMSSHTRCGVIEIMGNHCPDLTLYSGIACNADVIITKDSEYDENKVLAQLKELKDKNADHAIVCVAEKTIDTNKLLDDIVAKTGWDARLTVLGHIQRGGKPTAMERVNSIRMANYAINLLDQGVGGICVGMKDNEPKAYPILEALDLPRNKHLELYKLHDELK